jgi:hypothetical protein
VELIAAVLIVSWVIVFLRNTGAVETTTEDQAFSLGEQPIHSRMSPPVPY